MRTQHHGHTRLFDISVEDWMTSWEHFFLFSCYPCVFGYTYYSIIQVFLIIFFIVHRQYSLELVNTKLGIKAWLVWWTCCAWLSLCHPLVYLALTCFVYRLWFVVSYRRLGISVPCSSSLMCLLFYFTNIKSKRYVNILYKHVGVTACTFNNVLEWLM